MTNSSNPLDGPPIVCDMTDATDTLAERLDAYRRIFGSSLIGRERTADGIRFRFRAEEDLEDAIAELAAREKACCAFFHFTITRHQDEVWWDTSVVDDDIARQILEEYYRLPDSIGEGAEALYKRFTNQGLDVVINEGGTYRVATPQEVGGSYQA